MDRICYHPSKLYLASAYAPFFEDIATLIIFDYSIQYGLFTNKGPTGIGPDGIFVEPLLNALIRVMINKVCKAEFNWNVAKYFL